MLLLTMQIILDLNHLIKWFFGEHINFFLQKVHRSEWKLLVVIIFYF